MENILLMFGPSQDPSKLTDKDKAQQLELGPMSGESKWARVPEQIGIRNLSKVQKIVEKSKNQKYKMSGESKCPWGNWPACPSNNIVEKSQKKIP